MTTIDFLTPKERAAYFPALMQAIRDFGNRKAPDGLAVEVSRTLAPENPQFAPGGLLIPLSMLSQRSALQASSATAGGFLIAEDVATQIERVLRATSVCIGSGARILPGLVGNIALGRETGEVTINWLHELDAATEGESTFSAVNLSPHRAAGLTAISKELQFQSTPDISGFVIDSISRGIGVALDNAGLQGTGLLGQPLGIFSLNNVNTVTFGGASTWAKVVNFESQITQANGLDQNISFIGHPTVREKWKTLQRFTGVTDTLWNSDEDTIAGKPARVTMNMPAASICAGDFSQMLFGFWGDAVQVIVDPYAQKTSAVVEFYVCLYADVGVIRPQLFVINGDSALQ